jgi:hypothetical protein
MATVRFTVDAPVKGKQFKKDDLAEFNDQVADILVRDRKVAQLVPTETANTDAPAKNKKS